MFAKEIYIRRRSALCGKMGSGLILIPGNMLTPNNYLNNAYYFRQDSSFLYYFGLNTPALVGLIDADSGEVALYGDDFTVEDIIWSGFGVSWGGVSSWASVSSCWPCPSPEPSPAALSLVWDCWSYRRPICSIFSPG